MTNTHDVDAQLAAAADARNTNADAVILLALKSLGLSLRGRTAARYLEVTEGDQGAFDVSFQGLLDVDGNDLDEELNNEEEYGVMQLEDWRLNELVGPEEAPTFITVWLNGRTPVWRIDLEKASALEAGPEPVPLATVVLVDGKPRSSCCQASIECQKDYTDTNVYEVREADVDDDGKVVSVRYDYVKTYDGIDGQNWQVTCSACGRSVDDDSVAFEEG